jgi:hypothetical protein
MVRTCAFLLHTLSAERNYAVLLNRAYEGATLHSEVPSFSGSHADLLVLV